MLLDDTIAEWYSIISTLGTVITLVVQVAGICLTALAWRKAVLVQVRALVLVLQVASLVHAIVFLIELISPLEPTSHAFCSAVGAIAACTELLGSTWAPMITVMPSVVTLPLTCACSHKVFLGETLQVRKKTFRIIFYCVVIGIPVIDVIAMLGLDAFYPTHYGCWFFTGPEFADTYKTYNMWFYSIYLILGLVLTVAFGVLTFVRTRKELHSISEFSTYSHSQLVLDDKVEHRRMSDVEWNVVKKILTTSIIFSVYTIVEIAASYLNWLSDLETEIINIIFEFLYPTMPMFFIFPYLIIYWKYFFCER